jgi:hypothetical protein
VNTQESKLRSVDIVLDWQLYGIDRQSHEFIREYNDIYYSSLWNIALDANDSSVVTAAMNYLNSLYSKVLSNQIIKIFLYGNI